jgi:hypothetical protein
MRHIALGWIVLLFCFAPLVAAEPMPNEVREKLDALTGTWRGKFEVFTQEGRLHASLDVTQKYWWDGHVQRGRFVEVDSRGRRITAEARNFIDERGRLVCVVEKSSGEKTRHMGRLVSDSLAWHRRDEDTIETFVERVNANAESTMYEIVGMGVYGPADDRSRFVFRGRYEKVAANTEGAP